MPLTVSIVQQKGGVGKTSLAESLFAHLVSDSVSVGIVDLDPQGNATTWALGHERFLKVGQHCGAEGFTLPYGEVAKVLAGKGPALPAETTIADVVARHVARCERLGGGHVVPANIYMAVGAFTELRVDALPFDVVIVDTPPRLHTTLLRDIAAQSDAMLAPIQLEPNTIQNVGDLLNEVSYGNHRLLDNHTLRLVVTMRQKIAIHDAYEKMVRKNWPKHLSPVVIPRAAAWAEMSLPNYPWKPNSQPAKLAAELWADIVRTLKRRKAA